MEPEEAWDIPDWKKTSGVINQLELTNADQELQTMHTCCFILAICGNRTLYPAWQEQAAKQACVKGS